MKRCSRILILAFLFLCSWAGYSHSRTRIPPRHDLRPERPSVFEEILRAHGGREVIAAISGYNICFTRLTYTSPTEYFERQVYIAVQGARFKRKTSDPIGLRSRYEALDDSGNFQSMISSKDRNGVTTDRPLHADSDRLHAVQASIGVCSFPAFLQKLSQNAAGVHSLEESPQMLDKLKIITPGGEYLIFADQSHLIRRVEFGDLAFQFADYRSTGGLILPYVQRVSLNNRLVYEMYFSEIIVSPDFPPDYFKSLVW